ncbi:sensor histidine kinase [Metabacillus indicus]|uniref:sensor histidine kinase n=1 Tax=Metabacillus indicus TaxID=246786 RepID=UPI0004937AA6|nr:sensor histidine kinase [Metabacillus indicus]KEZ49261.1 histidine kinase [Metabacillus indicus LMG 22858]
MIRVFLKERLSWILFYLFIHLLFLFISFIDNAVPFKSVLYIVFLSLLSFLVFLAVRYQKETAFFKALQEREKNLDVTSIPAPGSPFEELVEETLVDHTGLLKKDAQRHYISLQQEKDDLLSWIHEVKTPLTAMHLMIERMEDGQTKTNLTYEWLRIHLLLDQQLHQKRIPFIENDLYIEMIDLEDVLFSELKTLQAWCIQKGIGFDIELQQRDVLTDAKWFAFILRQILTNAVKYSEASDIEIRSYLEHGNAKLEIRDYGRGIEARDLPRIFDKGFTSTANHQDQAATGMGLYLAKKAAAPLLIEIQAASVPGQETVFTLSFPKKNDFAAVMSM